MLNQLCNPEDRVRRDEHKHRCKRCGTCWKHSDDVADGTAEDFDEAHTCPGCDAPEQTTKIMDEAEVFKALGKFLGDIR